MRGGNVGGSKVELGRPPGINNSPTPPYVLLLLLLRCCYFFYFFSPPAHAQFSLSQSLLRSVCLGGGLALNFKYVSNGQRGESTLTPEGSIFFERSSTFSFFGGDVEFSAPSGESKLAC